MSEPARIYDSDPADDPEFGDTTQSISNIDAEAALLGALMIDNRHIDHTLSLLDASDFYEPVHGRIYSAIHKFADRGMNANPVTLRPVFMRDPGIQKLGGPGYLAMLTGSGVALIGVKDFALQIADLAARRKLVDAAKEAIERAYNVVDGGVEEIFAGVEESVRKSTERASPVRPNSAADMIAMVQKRQDAIVMSDGIDIPSCKSIPELDQLIGPLEPGLVIIGGRPGSGKSVVAESAAWGWAANGFAGEYYHAEMTEEQMAMRHAADLSLAIGSPIAHSKIRQGKLDRQDMAVLARVQEVAATLPLRFNAVGRCDVRQINSLVGRAKYRLAAQGRKLAFIVVDYMQLLKAAGNTKDFDRVSAVSKALLDIAYRNGITVVALSQLGRQVEERKDKRPQLADLRGSGDIEQDADAVVLLYREEVYLLREQPKKDHKDRDAWEKDFEAVRGKIELIGEKNRHGAPSTVHAKFFGKYFAIRGNAFDEFDVQPMLALDEGRLI